MTVDFERAVSVLKNNSKFIILTHASPDGDTLGSGYALALALKQLGKKSKVLNSDKIAEKYSFITDSFKNDDFDGGFIVSVDIAAKKLLGEKLEGEYGDSVDFSIDHHDSCRLFAKESYVESKSASTCEIIYLVINALGVKIDKEIASCLYTGCSTDTGCFRYSNVTARTHKIAAELIEYGADHAAINKKMFESKKRGFIELQKLCMENMEFHFDGKALLITVTRDMLDQTGTSDEDIDSIVAFSKQIEGVIAGVTLKQKTDGTFKVSVRTENGLDASKICAAFGGGGHLRAAGCSFKCSTEEIKQKMLDEIKNQMNI